MHLVKTKLNTKNLKVYVRAYIKMVWALFFFLVAKITSSLMKKLKGETSMNNEKIVKHIHWGANNSYRNNCSMGADLSQGDDFCSFTFLFPLSNGAFGIKTRNYISELTLSKLPTAMRIKYNDFMKEGSLIVMPGNILDMMQVYEDLDNFIAEAEYDVRCLGYDPYNARDFVERWERENGPFGIEKVIQGAKTESVPLGELKKLSEERMLIFDEALMSFTMGNCIAIEDTNGNRKLLKRRHEAKIDAVAAMMDAFVSLLDVTDEQTASGKLDLIIQLPYVIKTEARRAQVERRRKDIIDQLAGSQYGIAYTDGTEKITQLNRSLENNLLKQVEYLTNMVYSQLGITQSVLDGTADEKTMLNYMNRTVEPIISAIVDELKRKFLTKTARSQLQSIVYFRDPFRLVPVNDIAEIADKFTRNEIMTSNEIRQIVGMQPSKDPKADKLVNSNISQAKQDMSQTSSATEAYEEGGYSQNG